MIKLDPLYSNIVSNIIQPQLQHPLMPLHSALFQDLHEISSIPWGPRWSLVDPWGESHTRGGYCSFCFVFDSQKLVETPSNQHKLALTCRNLQKLTETYRNLRKLSKTCRNFQKLAETRKNLEKLEKSQKFAEIHRIDKVVMFVKAELQYDA